MNRENLSPSRDSWHDRHMCITEKGRINSSNSTSILTTHTRASVTPLRSYTHPATTNNNSACVHEQWNMRSSCYEKFMLHMIRASKEKRGERWDEIPFILFYFCSFCRFYHFDRFAPESLAWPISLSEARGAPGFRGGWGSLFWPKVDHSLLFFDIDRTGLETFQCVGVCPGILILCYLIWYRSAVPYPATKMGAGRLWQGRQEVQEVWRSPGLPHPQHLRSICQTNVMSFSHSVSARELVGIYRSVVLFLVTHTNRGDGREEREKSIDQ